MNRPVFRGSQGRIVKVTYEKNESTNFFQHRFLIDTDNFELNFIVPYNFSNKQSRLIFIDSNNNKKLVSESKKDSRGALHVNTWNINEKVNLNDIIRLEY